jgi:hypothetical protein
VGPSSIVTFSTSSDQYDPTPSLHGNGGGTGSASVTATANGCTSGGSGEPSPSVNKPDHIAVTGDNTTARLCSIGTSRRRIVGYNVRTASGSLVPENIGVEETVSASTRTSCTGGLVTTSSSCTQIWNGSFNDTLDPGCPTTATLAQGCGYTFPNQVWEWCEGTYPGITPISLGDIGKDVVDNTVINLGGNTEGFPIGTTFPH